MEKSSKTALIGRYGRIKEGKKKVLLQRRQKIVSVE
jgi:hypothetical protein